MDRQKDACTEVQLSGQPDIHMEQNTNILQTETVYKIHLYEIYKYFEGG
jgi:hypothetical protein